jgi:hypothetical protein
MGDERSHCYATHASQKILPSRIGSLAAVGVYNTAGVNNMGALKMSVKDMRFDGWE